MFNKYVLINRFAVRICDMMPCTCVAKPSTNVCHGSCVIPFCDHLKVPARFVTKKKERRKEGGRGERGRKREGVGGTQGDRWGIGHHKVSHARVRKDRAGATRGLRLGRPGHTLTVGRGAGIRCSCPRSLSGKAECPKQAVNLKAVSF